MRGTRHPTLDGWLANGLLLGRRGCLVDNFVAIGDGEFCSGRFVAIDVGYGDDLLSGAGIVVFDDEVEEEVGRVPVLVGDGDGLACTAGGGVDGALLLRATENGVVHGLLAEVSLGDDRRYNSGTHLRDSEGRNLRLCGHLPGGDGWKKSGLASEVDGGVVVGVHAGDRIEDVSFEQLGFAAEGGGDEATALIVEAALVVAGDVVDGGGDDLSAVR